MLNGKILRAAIASATLLAAAASATATRAEDIVVSNYGVTVNGMPYAVAKALGYFEEEGADVTGILSSSGGGTTIRNLMGGNLSYGESSLRSEEHTSELQSLMRISYAVFCLTTK